MQQLERENAGLRQTIEQQQHEIDTLKGIVDRLAKYAEEFPYTPNKQAKK